MRRTVLALAIVGGMAGATAAAAEALTTRDIIELSRAGLGEEVLLALIEVDRGIYAIDPAALKSLKAAGVSERVIVALVRSGRDPIPAEPQPVLELPVEQAASPPPQVVVIEHREPEMREVAVPVHVYVPVVPARSYVRRGGRAVHTPAESTYVPFQSGLPAVRPPVQQSKEPVYWGFGGKLRSDAWEPDGHKPDRRKSPEK